jgi:maltose O-acetyltransferase
MTRSGVAPALGRPPWHDSTVIPHQLRTLATRAAQSLVDAPVTPAGVRMRLLRSQGITIGHRAIVLPECRFYTRDVIIGRHAFVNRRVIFEGRGRVTIGSHVHVAIGAHLITTTHEVATTGTSRAGVQVTAPIVIEDGAWVGANAVILPGVTIGAAAIVAAGSIVRDDVAPNCVVGGVPSRVLRILDPLK